MQNPGQLEELLLVDAAMCLALGMARGALSAALQGDDMEGNRHVLEITSTAAVAKALRYANPT